MPSKSERATDLSFKKLTGYQYTTISKDPSNEQGAPQLKLHSNNVWTTSIPADPIVAILEHNNISPSVFADDGARLAAVEALEPVKWTDGVSFIRKKFTLNINDTDSTGLCWLIGKKNPVTKLFELGEVVDGEVVPNRGYIGTQYGDKYCARLIIANVERGTVEDNGWNFDYDTGILTFLNKSGITLTASTKVEIICYQYIGQIATESVGEPYDEVLGNFLIEPNAYYAEKMNSGYTSPAEEVNPLYQTTHHLTTISTYLDQAKKDKEANAVQYTIDSSQTVYNEADSDLVFNGGNAITAKTSVIGKTITVNDMDVASTAVSFAASGDIKLSNFSSTGNYPKDQGNAQISINTNDDVSISDCTFGETGYNTLEIGLGNTEPKSVIINNCKFVGAITNNAISIFAWADNAVINISNCEFEDVSNVLRISNNTNKKATITFTNCKFKKWETGAYAGAVICQDYKNTTPEAFASANAFAPSKVKINFVNCTGPGDVPVNGGSDPAAYCASADANQLVYVYGYVTNTEAVLPYSAARYPQVTFA